MTDEATNIFITRGAYTKLIPFSSRFGELYHEARRVWSLDGVTLTFSSQVAADLLLGELNRAEAVANGSVEVSQRCAGILCQVAR